MNSQVKEKWIAALRSGWYEQGSEKLRSVNGYCCLGVLCDLYTQETKMVGWEFRGAYEEENTQPMDYWYFDEESEFLPKSVMEWAGLETNCPEVAVEEIDDGVSIYDSIANLNDSGYSFSALSNIIEEQL